MLLLYFPLFEHPVTLYHYYSWASFVNLRHSWSPDTHMCSWTLHPPSVWSSAGLCSGRIAAVSSRSSRLCCESEHLSDSEPLRCCGSRPESEPSVSTAELLILQDKTIRPTLTANKSWSLIMLGFVQSKHY